MSKLILPSCGETVKVLGKHGRMALGAMEFGFLFMDSFVFAAFKSAFCHEVPNCIARSSPSTEIGPPSPSSYLPKVSIFLILSPFPARDLLLLAFFQHLRNLPQILGFGLEVRDEVITIAFIVEIFE